MKHLLLLALCGIGFLNSNVQAAELKDAYVSGLRNVANEGISCSGSEGTFGGILWVMIPTQSGNDIVLANYPFYFSGNTEKTKLACYMLYQVSTHPWYGNRELPPSSGLAGGNVLDSITYTTSGGKNILTSFKYRNVQYDVK